MPTCVCDPPVIDGRAYSRFWARWMGECIYTPQQEAAIACGFISIALYGVALAPQLYKSYRRKSVDGLSWALFVTWTLGDIANTLGAVLTQQFQTQVVTGIYFLFTELVLIAQYVYYARFYTRKPEPETPPPVAGPHHMHEHEHASHPRRHSKKPHPAQESLGLLHDIDQMHHHYASTANASDTQAADHVAYRMSSTLPIVLLLLSMVVHLYGASPTPSSSPSPLLAPSPSPPICNRAPDLPPHIVTLGCVLAWISGLFYFFSRLPQIHTNYKLQSVRGISVSLFVITLVANLFYGASILPRLDEIPRAKFYGSTLPYLIGGTGTLVWDIIIIGQAWYYGAGPDAEDIVPVPSTDPFLEDE